MSASVRSEPHDHRNQQPKRGKLSVKSSGNILLSVSGDLDLPVTDAEIELVIACLSDKLTEILGVA